MRSLLLLALLLITAPSPRPALASSPAPVCRVQAPPPPPLAGWTRRMTLTAGHDTVSAPMLAPGIAAAVTLLPVGGVQFAAPLGRPTAPADRGGLLTFRAPAAGTYRVALGAGGWVDLVRGPAAVASIAHSRGPDCTGIRKMVDFALDPGVYIVQISAVALDVMPMMIVRLP